MLEVTDQNFEEILKETEKPVLVDFWAEGCLPCFILGPILEKVAKDYQDKLIFAKANLNNAPILAQKLGIEKVPTVILFKKGKPQGGFVGLKSEKILREILDEMLKKISEKEELEEIEKTIKIYQEYTKKNGFKLNPEEKIVKQIIKSLLKNEKKYGAKYCPCRKISGDKKEDELKICPCFWHKKEIEKEGQCLCGLFVK
jgi:thioredoxin 1